MFLAQRLFLDDAQSGVPPERISSGLTSTSGVALPSRAQVRQVIGRAFVASYEFKPTEFLWKSQ